MKKKLWLILVLSLPAMFLTACEDPPEGVVPVIKKAAEVSGTTAETLSTTTKVMETVAPIGETIGTGAVALGTATGQPWLYSVGTLILGIFATYRKLKPALAVAEEKARRSEEYFSTTVRAIDVSRAKHEGTPNEAGMEAFFDTLNKTMPESVQDAVWEHRV